MCVIFLPAPRFATTTLRLLPPSIQFYSPPGGAARGAQPDYRIGDPILHIELRRWADIVLIAPCSANTLAKIATGTCDNLVVSPPSLLPSRGSRIIITKSPPIKKKNANNAD